MKAGIAKPSPGNGGFSLVELLVVMAMTGMVMTVVYSMFLTQNKSFTVQEQVAAMQQNLRAAMEMMEKEIRLAGYDPSGNANPAIQTATSTMFQFQWDENEDETITTTGDEQITYALSGTDLRRGSGTGPTYQMIAENIETLDFVYLDANNAVTTALSEICGIELTLIARAAREDFDYTDGNVYTNLQGTEILNKSGSPDHYRRQMLTARIKCRNLGLD